MFHPCQSHTARNQNYPGPIVSFCVLMSQVMASEGDEDDEDEDEDDDAWISLDICVWNKHIGSMKTYHENFPSCVHQGID